MKKEIDQLIENLQDTESGSLAFPVSDESFDYLFCWTETIYRLEDKGYRLNFRKTPKGKKYLLIVPSIEKLHEIEQLEEEIL